MTIPLIDVGETGGGSGGTIDSDTNIDSIYDDSSSSTTSSGSTSSSTTTTTTFNPDTQTLGTTSGVAEADEVEVVESTADPSDSSPAGGAGLEEAVERFTGAPDESLADVDSDTLVDLGNAASDVYEADTDEERQQEIEEFQELFNEATGQQPEEAADDASSGPSRAAIATTAVAIAVVLFGGG